MSGRRVVITGVGPVSPIGVGTADFWNGLLEGRSAIRRIAPFDPSRFDSQIGGAIEGCTINDVVPKAYRKAGKMMARDIVLAVLAAHKAVTDAGLVTKCLVDRGDHPGPCNLDSTRFGANIGAGAICADLPELAEALSSARDGDSFSLAKWGADGRQGEGMNNLTPLWLLKFLPNMLACHVTIVHDAQGPSNTITCGEASSHLAIGEGFRTIQRGVAEVCICGGAESKMNPMALLRQSLAGRLSRRNDMPAAACRPFGKDADGTVVSEGGGLVLLEELEHARKRGARIYAELVGFGASNDACAPGHPHKPCPDGRGARLAAAKAVKDAGLSTEAIDLVAAFAPGIPAYDRAEAAAIRGLLGPRANQVPTLAIKGAIGNNGAGSGSLDFIAAILALYNATVPPTVNADAVDASLGLRVVAGGPTDAKIGHAISLAYALGGGQNAALVIRKYKD